MKIVIFILMTIFFALNFLANTIAGTITVKCYVDEKKSFSFLINKEKKEILWLDQKNQKMVITVFPDIDKGGNLIIMGGTGSNNEKHTFILDTTKATVSVITNLGYNKAGKCGDKSIFEKKDPYKEK